MITTRQRMPKLRQKIEILIENGMSLVVLDLKLLGAIIFDKEYYIAKKKNQSDSRVNQISTLGGA